MRGKDISKEKIYIRQWDAEFSGSKHAGESSGFRPMRRKERELSGDEAKALLRRVKWGVLSLGADDNGYPYAVPINCAYTEGALLFHCAPQGGKLDVLRRDDRVCFTAALNAELSPGQLTTYYESVICYGRLREIPRDETPEALTALTAGLFGMDHESAAARISGDLSHPPLMLRLQIEHISAKKNAPPNP